MIRAAKHRQGFTLLELILAMAMVAVLSVALYMSMGAAFRARESALASLEPSRAATIAADLLAQDLESVLPPTGILAGAFVGSHEGSGEGEIATLTFYSVGGGTDGEERPLSEGIRCIELTVRTDLTPPALVRRVTRNLLAPTQPEPEEEILCRGVRSFALQYFDGSVWQEDWDSTLVGDVLPASVQLNLEVDCPQRKGQQPATYRIARLMPLACAKPADTSEAGGAP